MSQSIKIYANNLTLAHQQLETVFTLMRNERLLPAEIMVAVYGSLTSGIDASDSDRAAVLDAMKSIIKEHSRKHPLMGKSRIAK